MAELIYLSTWEDKMQAERYSEEFKNQVFAADLVNNLENFRVIFKNDLDGTVDEEALEWEIPKGQEELDEVLAAISGMRPEPVEEHRV